LGQMFFDISALANYFIAQKDQTSSGVREKIDKPGSVSFEDFLTSLSNQEISRKQESNGTDSAFTLPGLWLAQAVNESNSANGEMPFYVSQKNIVSSPYQIALNSNIQQTERAYSTRPVEAFEASLITANELKDISKSQAIIVTINIDQSLISKNMNIDLDLLSTLNQINKTSLNYIDANSGTTIKTNQAETNLNNNLDFIDQGKSIDLSSYTKLSFAIDKMLSQEQAAIDVKAFDLNKNLIEFKAPVEQLKQIVENYPDNIIVQIKAGGHSNQSYLASDSIPVADSTEEYVLFDLKSLIQAEDMDKIKIVHKTVVSDRSNQGKNSAGLDIDLLNNLRFNKIQTINIKDNSPLNNKMIELNDLLDQSVIDPKKAFSFSQKDQSLSQAKHAGEQAGNNPKSEPDQTEKAAINYSGAKSTEIAQNPKSTGSSLNQSLSEVNSVQQGSIKTSDTPVDFKNAELLTGKNITGDNLEIIEKIIGQIKSKFVTAPEYTRMTIDLKPENLGKIKLDFEYEGEKIKALLQVDNLKVKLILDADLPRLKSELKIDSIKVEIALNDFKQGNNTSYQRSHFAKYENNHPPRYSEFNEPDEIDGKIKSGMVQSAKANVYHGGIVNLLA